MEGVLPTRGLAGPLHRGAFGGRGDVGIDPYGGEGIEQRKYYKILTIKYNMRII